jgi:hypothetical protein
MTQEDFTTDSEAESKSHDSESRVPEACKEGETQFKAISIICNLSANDEQVPEAYRLPCLLRMRLLSQTAIDEIAKAHGIDHYAFRRHELENLLVSHRKTNIREKLWAHEDVVRALLETAIHGSNKFRHLVLKMFLNFSFDENIAVEMVEGNINFMEPLMNFLDKILSPLTDVLEQKQEVVIEEEEEPVPDPRFLPKVQVSAHFIL